MSVRSSARDSLLRAAVDVFASKGYTATRVSDIVERAGVAQGTFYLYFKSKQVIFEELFDSCFSRLLADTMGTLSVRDVSRPEEVIDQFARIGIAESEAVGALQHGRLQPVDRHGRHRAAP